MIKKFRPALTALALLAAAALTAPAPASADSSQASPNGQVSMNQQFTVDAATGFEGSLTLPAGVEPYAAIDLRRTSGSGSVSLWLWDGDEGVGELDTTSAGGPLQVLRFQSRIGFGGPLATTTTVGIGVYAEDLAGPIGITIGGLSYQEAELTDGGTATVSFPKRGAVADLRLGGFFPREPVRVTVVDSSFTTPAGLPVAREVLSLAGAGGVDQMTATPGSSTLVPALVGGVWTPTIGKAGEHLTLMSPTGDRGSLTLRVERAPATPSSVTLDHPFKLTAQPDGFVDHVLTLKKPLGVSITVRPQSAPTGVGCIAFSATDGSLTWIDLTPGARTSVTLPKGRFTIRTFTTSAAVVPPVVTIARVK